MTDPTDETRPDRLPGTMEHDLWWALNHLLNNLGSTVRNGDEEHWSGGWRKGQSQIVGSIRDVVRPFILGALPAPHPQGGTEALRHGISALIETYEDTSAVPNDRLRALLAAAPAPTPGACICDGAAYNPDQRYPFLVHPECPRHTAGESC